MKQAIKILNWYQQKGATVLKSMLVLPEAGCRFYPSCSEYGKQAIKKHGLLRGGVKSLWRILRCNPYNKGGIDLP